MKKVVVVVASLALLASSVGIFSENVSVKKANATNFDFAEYVSVENAPVIDGIREDVWDTGASYIQTKMTDTGTEGYIDILWNETGLYFYAEVTDFTLNASDLCNFWVSETYLTSGARTYPEVDGAYYLCLNKDGRNAFYAPDNFDDAYVDMTEYYTVATQTTAVSYCIELFVEVTGTKPLVKGNSIGFDVSIDDYLYEGTSIDDRECYTNWNGEGWYWERPSNLGEIKLVDLDKENGSPVENTTNNNDSSDNTSASNSTNSETTSSNESTSSGSGENKTNEQKSGCSSTVVVLPVGVMALGVGLLFLKKKEK